MFSVQDIADHPCKQVACCETCSKVEQHLKCMNDAILHGKPFGNSFYKIATVKQRLTFLKRQLY